MFFKDHEKSYSEMPKEQEVLIQEMMKKERESGT